MRSIAFGQKIMLVLPSRLAQPNGHRRDPHTWDHCCRARSHLTMHLPSKVPFCPMHQCRRLCRSPWSFRRLRMRRHRRGDRFQAPYRNRHTRHRTWRTCGQSHLRQRHRHCRHRQFCLNLRSICTFSLSAQPGTAFSGQTLQMSWAPRCPVS